MFKIRYTPQIGDVVTYNGKRMVIIKQEFLEKIGQYVSYLLEESLLKDFSDFTETTEILSKCISASYNVFEKSLRFKKVGSLPIKVEQKTYLKISF